VVNPISRFWNTKQMSRTINSGDHGSVVTGSRVVDELEKEAEVGLNGGQMVFEEIAAELAPDYPLPPRP
jgi:hypothetical protein